MTFAALLLDLDGTLVDSEPCHFRAHRIFLAGQGVGVTEEDLVGNIGKGDETFYAELAARCGRRDVDVAAWVAAKTDVLIGLYARDGLPTRTGASALLDAAGRARVPAAVVTSSERRLATAALAASGAGARLPLRICREDTPRHKPDPAPYRLAAQRLGVAPAACLVVEDSPSGIRAALAAGMTVIAIRSLVGDDALRAAGATRLVDDLAAVAPLLGAWAAG